MGFLKLILQIYLDIKCTKDPVIKLPIVVLPEVPAVKNSPAPAEFGFEALGKPNQPTWSSTPQQAAHQPLDPPPPYGVYAMPQYTNTHLDKSSTAF